MGKVRTPFPDGSFLTPQEEMSAKIFANITMLLIVLAIIFALIKLCKMVKKNTLQHNAERIAIAIVLTLLLCWPVAIGQGIYVLLKWKETKEPPTHQPQTPEYKTQYKDDYERWKEERMREKQENE